MFLCRCHACLHVGQSPPVVYAAQATHPHASPLAHEVVGMVLTNLLQLKGGISPLTFDYLECHFLTFRQSDDEKKLIVVPSDYPVPLFQNLVPKPNKRKKHD